MSLGDIPSNFFVARRLFVNFLCGRDTFRQLPSTFRAATSPSFNFRKLSVQPGDLPSSLANFL